MTVGHPGNSGETDRVLWTSSAAVFTLLLLLHREVDCLQCHDCHDMTVLKTSPSFRADCGYNPGPMKEGFAGCLEIWGLTDQGQVLVIRTGHTNKQTEGRVPSCYHAEQSFVVDAVVEGMKFDTISTCYACDHRDGCNSGISIHSTQLQQLNLVLLSTILVLISTKFR